MTEVDDGILTENLSTVACIVFVMSPESAQRFELDVGEKVTVTGLTEPISFGVVRSVAARQIKEIYG